MTAIKEARGPFLGARHLQTFLLFLAIVVTYGVRLNVSVSLVAMTNAATSNPDFQEFDWDEKKRSYIISSFYWSYFMTQFPGAFMSRRFGVKITMLISICGSALFSIIIPFCVTWGGWQAYCVIRICQGLLQGLMFPCVHDHIAKWSPLNERTRLGGLSHTGVECGTILAMGLTGIIANSSMGWPGISYIFGGFGVIFSVAWLIFADDSPAVARFITNEEKHYILSSQASVRNDINKKIPIPWKAIFTSVPFLSLFMVRICEGWGFTTMQAEIPAYIHGVLKMNIKSNALYSALPYLVMWIFANVFVVLADVILKKQWLTLSVVRKTINTIAMWIPAALFIGIGFLGEEQKALAITFMTLNVGLNGGQTIGSSLNTIDLSPNHAGLLMGIINCIGNFIPILTPLVAGVIVYDETQRLQWQIVFGIGAVFFFFGNLQYIFLAKTDPQPWNDEDFLLKGGSERNEDKGIQNNLDIESIKESEKQNN